MPTLEKFKQYFKILEDIKAEKRDFWDPMEHLGPFGETLLHIACLYNQNDIAEFLVATRVQRDHAEKLLDARYQEQPYRGETALHIAIAQGNVSLVKLLLKNKADINGRCVGSFFRGSTGIYTGELPQSFAAAIPTSNNSNKDIFDLLMAHVAEDPNSRPRHDDKEGDDRLKAGISQLNHKARAQYDQLAEVDEEAYDHPEYKGNTTFHVLVITGNIDMYEHIVSKYSQVSLLVEKKKNARGLTPLALAAKLGLPEFFQYLVMRTKISHWNYGLFLPFYSLSPCLQTLCCSCRPNGRGDFSRRGS